jgi:hypothetical protein
LQGVAAIHETSPRGMKADILTYFAPHKLSC